MFARNVSMHLKPNSVAEFTRTLDQEIIPLLRKQKGFQDEITFVAPGGLEAIGISLWEQKENAEAYNRGTYPEVLKALGEVEDSFLTCFELQQLMEKLRFQVKGYFVSTKEDWELYIKPVYIAMRELIESKSELAEEAQRVMNSFKAEYDAVGQHWNMVLWVVKAY